jgi:hypothetical protein
MKYYLPFGHYCFHLFYNVQTITFIIALPRLAWVSPKGSGLGLLFHLWHSYFCFRIHYVNYCNYCAILFSIAFDFYYCWLLYFKACIHFPSHLWFVSDKNYEKQRHRSFGPEVFAECKFVLINPLGLYRTLPRAKHWNITVRNQFDNRFVQRSGWTR